MAKDKWFVGKMYLQLVSQRANASVCRKEASDCSPYQGEGASLLVTLASKEPLDESERGQWKSWLKAQHSGNEDHGIQSHHFMANRWGNNGNSERLFWGLQRSLQMVTATMKLKDACSLEESLWPAWTALKSRDITLPTKVHLVHLGYGFSCGHVWMWELDCEESWALKNWCFWTVVLEKTLESPLDCKEIQPVHFKGD